MMCFSDVFPFFLQRVQEFYGRYFNPLLSLPNVFIYTEKGKHFGEIFKTIKFPYHFIPSIHSIYKLFKLLFCKKKMFFDIDFFWSSSFVPIAMEFFSNSLDVFSKHA